MVGREGQRAGTCTDSLSHNQLCLNWQSFSPFFPFYFFWIFVSLSAIASLRSCETTQFRTQHLEICALSLSLSSSIFLHSFKFLVPLHSGTQVVHFLFKFWTYFHLIVFYRVEFFFFCFSFLFDLSFCLWFLYNQFVSTRFRLFFNEYCLIKMFSNQYSTDSFNFRMLSRILVSTNGLEVKIFQSDTKRKCVI